ANSAYYQARPTLNIPHDKVITLNSSLGMAPTLQALTPLWKGKKMAVVEGVGYPNPNLSHFASMDIWQTLDLNGQGAQGWLGKYVAGLVDNQGHPFQSLAVGQTLPMALQAINAPVPVVQSPQSYQLQGDPTAPISAAEARIQALLKLYNTYPQSAPYAALLDATAQNAVSGSKQLEQAASQYKPAVTYPNTGLAQGLQVLAEAIVQDLGLRVGYVTQGGYDSHADQVHSQPQLLQDLAEAVTAFYNDLAAHNASHNVVIMTWSEFGRRVEENASLGTDHGTAAPLFVFGDQVVGGIYGESPDLGSLDEYGNLKFTVDFRSVYATVLDRWLGASAKGILGGSFGDQEFLPPGA
ncbi:MAG TPA: DUF1501 domain-containing protein, partial [Ktedonobacterales bacterium]|nr:DUF1501 domain-containing protein [Ktedonobacterales bacterium]